MVNNPQALTIERVRTASGVKWLGVSQTIQLATQFLGMVVLARILPPSDYGLLAMAVVVTGFVNLFSDFGTAAGIIQRQEPSDNLINSVFWLNVIFGVGLFSIVALLAPLIALSFGEPRLQYVLWALMLTFPIASVGALHRVLLEKQSHFRPVAVIEAISALIGLGAAVWAALTGWGVFSLVLQPISYATLTSISYWLVSPWRPKLRSDRGEIRSMMHFSGNLVGFNVFNYFARNADNLLIGYVIGSAGLGIYSIAYRIMLFPLSSISVVVNRAFFPSFSRLQSDHRQMGALFIHLATAIIFFTAPILVGLFVLREPFVQVVLGNEWSEVSGLLYWLAPIGLLQSVGTCVGIIYMATGRTDVQFKWGVSAGLLSVAAFVLGLPWGIKGVAIAYFSISMLMVIPSFVIPFRLIGLDFVAFVRAMAGPTLLSMAMGLVVYGTKEYFPLAQVSVELRLMLWVLLGAVTYLALSIAFQRRLLTGIFLTLLNR